MDVPPHPDAGSERTAEDASARAPARTILKFDSGRRAFTRAIVILAVSAGGLLAFAVYFFWNLL